MLRNTKATKKISIISQIYISIITEGERFMLMKEQVAHDKSLDSTLSLMKDGYLFIKNRMDEFHCGIFETHLLGEKVICMSGEEASKLFYNEELFMRKGVAPKRVQKTLFGMHTVQSMDGTEHAKRKQLFMSQMTEATEKKLADLVGKEFENSISKWKGAESIVLFDEVKEILCKVACFWAGVPLNESDVKYRADDFYSMVDGFGGVGPRYWKGKRARSRTEDWIRSVVEDVRTGRLLVAEGTPLFVMAYHREFYGGLMNSQIAAVELINILRPIVAIATYITFEALALYENPECERRISAGDENYIKAFVQEVRRFYPFTPFLGARAKKDFIWNDCVFKEGTLVLLDVYGTDHDHKIWNNPEEFKPERFMERKDELFDFIPQGGGNPAKGHRCPGEGITIEIMKASLDFLVNKVEFVVPEQDLKYSLSRIPTLPNSGFVIKSISRKI